LAWKTFNLAPKVGHTDFSTSLKVENQPKKTLLQLLI
jgi:hypothetical protein